MASRYIFIVGLPRTGTKLMMNVLENNQEKACYITPENFFLGRFLRPGIRRQMRQLGDLSVEANLKKLVDNIYSARYTIFRGDYWSELAEGKWGFDKETMFNELLDSDRSDKAIYTILLRCYANGVENVILGDKTGPHLYRVPTLLEWFPEAKVIHTLRDPRAVLASEHKKQLRKLRRHISEADEAGRRLQALVLRAKEVLHSMLIIVYITIAWLYAARLDRKYKKRYPNNYYLSRFEDLVSQPEESVRSLCYFLGIAFNPAMLNPPKVDSSFGPKGGAGFNTQTLNSWQSYLKPWMKRWWLLLGKKQLKEFHYI
jgi:hypothetical protein